MTKHILSELVKVLLVVILAQVIWCVYHEVVKPLEVRAETQRIQTILGENK
jgi:hypothetical protein